VSISNTSYVILETVLIVKQSTQRRNPPVLYSMKTDRWEKIQRILARQ